MSVAPTTIRAAGGAVRAIATLSLYVALVLAPLGGLLLADTPAKGGFWWDVAIALGFAGLAMLAIQFVLTARSRAFAAPFGIDVLYYFHRFAAFVLLAAVLGHVALLIALRPALLAELNPLRATPAMLAGLGALALLLGAIVTSAWRKPLRIPYDAWRRAHLVLAVGAVALGFVHLRAIGYYSGSSAMSALWTAVAASLVLIVLWVRVGRPLQLLCTPYRVASVAREQGDAWTLTLEPQGHRGFRFLPGQFAWLSLGESPFAMREHPFSIACAPRPSGELEFTIKELGDFTRTMGTLPVGTQAFVDGPYGAFSIDRHPRARGYVLIAGGIGIAPMLGMLDALAERADRRPHLLFTAHSRHDRIPRLDAVERFAGQLRLTVVHVLEDPPPVWHGERGRITRAVLDRHLPPERSGYEYFVCGPSAMAQAMERLLHELGVPLARVHTELFDMA